MLAADSSKFIWNLNYFFKKKIRMSNLWSWQLAVVLIGILANIKVVRGQRRPDIDIDGPIITPNKSEIILKHGQNFTLSCKSNYPITIEQQAIPEEMVDPFRKALRNTTDPDNPFEYTTELDLFNVNRFAVGYYACFHYTMNGSEIFKNLLEEPTNTEYISYIYIYVDDTGSLFAPISEVVIVQNKDSVVIECKPTTPDVNVTLYGQQNNKIIEPLKYSPKIGFLIQKGRSRVFKCHGQQGNVTKWKKNITYRSGDPLLPDIKYDYKDFLEGETFSLNCTVTYQTNSPITLEWKIDRKDNILVITNENNKLEAGSILYKSLTVVNATEEDAKNYKCVSKSISDKHAEATVQKIYQGKAGYMSVTTDRNEKFSRVNKSENKYISIKFFIKSYPPATYTLYKNDAVIKNGTKYSVTDDTDYVLIKIKTLSVFDTANYTLVLSNKYKTESATFKLDVTAKPVINTLNTPEDDKIYLVDSVASLLCEAVGNPLPKIKWIFSDEKGNRTVNSDTIEKSEIQISSRISIRAIDSGNITCIAENKYAVKQFTRRFIVNEVSEGFGIRRNNDNANEWFYEGQQVQVRCYASIYYYTDVKWFRGEDDFNGTIQNTTYSIVTILNIPEISLSDSGEYTCRGYKFGELERSDTVIFDVAASKPINISYPEADVEEEVNPYEKLKRGCTAEAIPPPKITWYKDGEILSDNITYGPRDPSEHGTIVESTVVDIVLIHEDRIVYECEVESGGSILTRSYTLISRDKSQIFYVYIIAAILFVLVIIIAYLLWKVHKDRKFKRELLKAGLLYFKKGVPKSINPELGIDEQAELLPYDERFEYPFEKLKLGKQLGAGAFGVVYKAEARGIINAEETTLVAVKMVKRTADNMYIKALASELKIMVHLGKHVNIVNLMGACTKNVAKRELSVIVEYCKFGNIHNYMQKHREVFIDQFTDNKDKNFGKVNRGFESTTGSSGMQSDYFGSNHTQETDHTFVNTANTNRSGRKASETGYIQPEWRSNYESDYVDGRNPRPLTSRDLLAWAFQIARGMEYLASKKVLHGDLAARNVLLAEDNIVKICDFGLARSIYKNDEYQKQENSPLPVKWLAIECMTDRIFSTQSDVWSFGIVLWELFSLAKTPYPNVSPSSLVQWLSDGHRLDKPQYADDRLYGVMLRCWQQKPTARPNFTQLQETLGSFLEDNVRNHYVDLNSAYMDFNKGHQTEEDYLAMMLDPDYKNMVTPSPHHYVNETRSFFPPTPSQLQHDLSSKNGNDITEDIITVSLTGIDDEGYLQMSPTNQSIFSPRVPNTKFDFDPRKLNPHFLEPGQGPGESTPMLSLNNLPARGSESDYDGASPYLNMCKRIDEEPDEVFENENNFKNSQRNQNIAVTNPTYITLEVNSEKKPQNISNNYINVNVPNGLVK